MTMLNAALEYLDRGWSVIPTRPDTKRPRVKWREFQDRQPTEEEVTQWWTNNPDDGIALVTGAISGLVVVDCDNDAALDAALKAGMVSPVRAKTKRGVHLYFAHPMDGVRRGPRAGNNSRGQDWPQISGLDFRGDGSYALLSPTEGYTWNIAPDHDFDDTPVWKDWRPSLGSSDPHHFDFSELDLSDVRNLRPEDLMDEWTRTSLFVRENFPSTLKIPSGMGNARNDRLMRYASECVREGIFGGALRVRCHTFQREFYEDALAESEFEATVSSMEEAERRNHPERFDEAGNYIYVSAITPRQVETERVRRLITMSDADALMEKSKTRQYLIEPWLAPATIVQVYGYSGHGKSMFVQHCMAALAAGKRCGGPFPIQRRARVLYCDYEMGMGTVARRLSEMRQMYGDTDDRLQIWTPFVDEVDMNLRSSEGLNELQAWVNFVQPDVVVIDTIRSAFPGLQENSADEWARVNQLAVKLRNSGVAVILMHHSNKPGENGMGREAGSTNQLTVLDTQIRVTQVFQDQETARQNAALFDGDYSSPIWPQLEGNLPHDARLYMCMEIRYGKVREWTEEHDRVQWIGLGASNTTEERHLVSSRSSKQRAKEMALSGRDPSEIAMTLARPVRLVREWLEIAA